MAIHELRDCRGFAVLYNRTVPGMKPDFPEGVDQTRCLQVPDFGNPWKEGKDDKAFFQEVIRITGVLGGDIGARKKRAGNWKKAKRGRNAGIWHP